MLTQQLLTPGTEAISHWSAHSHCFTCRQCSCPTLGIITAQLRMSLERLCLRLSQLQWRVSRNLTLNINNEVDDQSAHISMFLPDGPKFSVLSVSPSGELVEGSSVTLTCSTDAYPAPSYTWYKDNQVLRQGSVHFYNFSSISSEDSGVYKCQTENHIHRKISQLVSLEIKSKLRPNSKKWCSKLGSYLQLVLTKTLTVEWCGLHQSFCV